MITILPTDIIFYGIIISSVVGWIFLRKNIQFQDIVSAVKSSKIGMATLVVLILYIAIAFLDSLHYRPFLRMGENGQALYYSQPKSVLDNILSPWDELSEKTYSAPLAKNLYSKETIIKDGSRSRVYPELKHINRDNEIIFSSVIFMAFLKAILLVSILYLIWLFIYARVYKHKFKACLKKIVFGQGRTAWRTFWLCGFVCLVIMFVVYNLAQYYHVFGTDKVGDDVFYMSIKGVRTAIIIGTFTTLVLLPIAIIFGICAGYFGGIVDDIIQYIYTTLNSIPGILLIAALALMMNVFMSQHPNWFASSLERADVRLIALCLILGVTNWTGLCRLLRAETLKIRELDYIMAAKVMGVSRFKIMLKHILPNVMYLVIISIAMDFSGFILAESILSYVGIGVDPTMASWGNMINSARLELGRSPVVWWPLISAFVLLFTLVLCANLFADVIRDALDPRLRK